MLLFAFGFLFYWKIGPNSRTSDICFTTLLQRGHVNVVKNKISRLRKQFLIFNLNT